MTLLQQRLDQLGHSISYKIVCAPSEKSANQSLCWLFESIATHSALWLFL